MDLTNLPQSVQDAESQAQVSSDRIKPAKTNYYGEPPGIDYGKVFAEIGQFFSRVAKFIEDKALSIYN